MSTIETMMFMIVVFFIVYFLIGRVVDLLVYLLDEIMWWLK